MSTFDPTQFSDDDLRAALFDGLVARLDAQALEDSSITIVNRMPTAFAISRRGNLLTLAQGIGQRLLRGDLKWKDRYEQPRTFTVGRAAKPYRLIIAPDQVEGAPDEILDRIVAMFLAWTAPTGERRPLSAEPQPETRSTPHPAPRKKPPTPHPGDQSASRSTTQANQPAPRGPHERPTLREALEARRTTSAESAQQRQPAAPRTQPERRAALVDATRATTIAGAEERSLAVPIRDTASKAEATLPQTTPTLRTYQLLFETAQRELEQAKAVPAGTRYALISAGVFLGLTAEAFFNDLGARMMPAWSQLQRLDPREKAEVLNIELFHVRVDWSLRPFHSVAAALGFRRALAQAHAETLPLDRARPADRPDSEVPRTRRTVWQEHCEVATIEQWITDVRLLIDHYSKAHDAAEVTADRAEDSRASR